MRINKESNIAKRSKAEKPNRRSIRLKDYDYSEPGHYFVTICTHGHKGTLGKIEDGKVKLTQLDLIAERCWQALPRHFPNIALDAYVVMPNHIHGVIVVNPLRCVGAKDSRHGTLVGQKDPSIESFAPEVPEPASKPSGTRRGSLAAIMQTFKSVTTRKANKIDDTPAGTLWQRNYYEHVVRNSQSLDEIRQYILANPWMWPKDKYFAG